MDCLQDKFGTVLETPEKPQTLLGEFVDLVSRYDLYFPKNC